MSLQDPDHPAPMSMNTMSPSRMILSDGMRLGGAMCSPDATNGVSNVRLLAAEAEHTRSIPLCGIKFLHAQCGQGSV
jgi:hypothetical protein